jgi:hypothetical protein
MDEQKIKDGTLSLRELHDLIREVEALDALYQTNRIVFFRPLPHGDQWSFFEAAGSRVRLVLGSNRSGKTECGSIESISHSLGFRPWLDPDHPLYTVRLANGEPIPVPNVGRVIAQSFEANIKQTIWQKFENYAPQHLIKRVGRNSRGIPVELEWSNGSVTYFHSDDQDDVIFEGPNHHHVWIDEPCAYRKYTGLKRGLVDHDGVLWLTMTPLGAFWINEQIVDRAEVPGSGVRMFRFSIWHNCTENGGYLSRAAIEEFLSDLREDELEARLHGNFIHLAGRVYKVWEPKPPYWVEPFDIPPSWPRVCVIDPHPRKPIMVLWLAVNPDDQVFVYRELWRRDLDTVKKVTDEMKRLERTDYGSEPVVLRLIDTSAQEQEKTSGESVRWQFYQYGMGAHLAQKRNAQAGYDAIKDALERGPYDWGEPNLVVFNTCTKTKHDFMNFAFDDWQTSKQRDLMGEKDAYRKTHDDAIDCLRYYYQGRLNYHRLKSLQRQNEQREYREEQQSLRGRYQINMPGLRTGYGG